MVQEVDAVAVGSAASECPPPLAWSDVLQAFRTESDRWYLERPRYRLTGRQWGAGRPLYLLNGFGGTHELYSLLVWLLRDEFRCVLWDYPGTAEGSPTARSATLGDLAADIRAIADARGDAVFDLYAPSFGSLVALQALIDFPQRTGRVFLQGGFAHRRLSRFERFLARSCRFYPGLLRKFPGSRAVRQHNHRRWFPPFDETRWQFLEDNVGRVPVTSLAWQAALIRDADFRPYLSRIDRRVHLIETEGEGTATRACQRELAELLPSATTDSLLGTGQYPYLTHPHRLAKIIRQP
ncbi:MAG: alpha/beta fold hydrolase [Planctomycetaceae bacterium]